MPSPCTAFSQSLSVNSPFCLDQVTRQVERICWFRLDERPIRVRKSGEGAVVHNPERATSQKKLKKKSGLKKYPDLCGRGLKINDFRVNCFHIL